MSLDPAAQEYYVLLGPLLIQTHRFMRFLYGQTGQSLIAADKNYEAHEDH